MQTTFPSHSSLQTSIAELTDDIGDTADDSANIVGNIVRPYYNYTQLSKFSFKFKYINNCFIIYFNGYILKETPELYFSEF